ncbi:S24 family peptidase [Pseudomonas donghuensis]|uniref:Helix-turn-helix transcriptional regulator n=1 Tax=Pseudomonas donghuensis TaxID=1163398 RepID=A0AAQ0DP41_9PSED|nr:S24 family peptidase [Pseudomonas donghuensis]QWE81231.1 helix-turn-helix transcriptional regulator [Pseudomonas donghuensis]
MDIYEKRLIILKALIGENQLKDFASAHADVDASYLSQILNGHRTLGDRAATNLTKKLGIPAEILTSGSYTAADQDRITRAWLVLGLKPPALPHPAFFNGSINETAQRVVNERQNADQLPAAPVPVVGKAILDPSGHFNALEFPSEQGEGYIDIVSPDASAYSLKVVGNSLHPRIKNGEYVLIEPGCPYRTGDEVLVTTVDGKAMVKEYIYHREGQYRFDSISDGSPPTFLDERFVAKIHFLAAILKASKHLDY